MLKTCYNEGDTYDITLPRKLSAEEAKTIYNLDASWKEKELQDGVRQVKPSTVNDVPTVINTWMIQQNNGDVELYIEVTTYRPFADKLRKILEEWKKEEIPHSKFKISCKPAQKQVPRNLMFSKEDISFYRQAEMTAMF